MNIETTDWQSKVWGRTRCVARGPNFEVHLLEINQGFRCSRHRHRKWNQFYVVSGRVSIVEWNDSAYVGTAHIDSGRDYTVPPGMWHRFETHKSDAVVIETYWTDAISPEDIERLDEGGPL